MLNGDFDTPDGWALGAGWSIANGMATTDRNSGGNTAISRSSSMQTGALHRITYTVTDYQDGDHRAAPIDRVG